MNNLDDIHLFTKVAQLGSYTKAARQLNIPLATVSRRIKHLEQRLNVQLINRDTRKLGLTEAGSYLFNASAPLLSQLEDIEQEASDYQTNPIGNLRITAPVEISINLLNEIISDFMQLYPQISIDLNMTNDLVDIINQGYDLAIRGGALKDSNLISRKIMSSKLYYCCSPEYVSQYGLLQNPEDAEQHVFLTYQYDYQQYLRLSKDKQEVILQPGKRISANSFDFLMKASKKGLGISVLPASLCFRAVMSGELITLMQQWRGADIALYALYPNRVKTKKLELFIEYLEQRLKIIETEFSQLDHA